tara:strand:- start:371 stop:703 length:333 start_codon:yes stop_codon:yes gene_type:complete
LASLVKKVDNLVEGNSGSQLRAFLCLLAKDTVAAEATLKQFGKKHKIRNVPLTVYNGSAGPANYKIAKKASFTVLFWRGLEIRANYATDKEALSADDVHNITENVKSILQ